MPNICVSGSGQHWFRQWLVTYSAPSHYLNQCWVIINWILRNKLQRNFNQSMKFSFTSMHLKMSPATWRPFCSGEDELSVAQRVFFQVLSCWDRVTRISRWRHQMDTFSALRALCEGNPPVIDGFPSERPVTRSFDVFLDLRLNKRLSKQSMRRWFETPPRSLWRPCNGVRNQDRHWYR